MGLAPTTHRLKVCCSTIELRFHIKIGGTLNIKLIYSIRFTSTIPIYCYGNHNTYKSVSQL